MSSQNCMYRMYLSANLPSSRDRRQPSLTEQLLDRRQLHAQTEQLACLLQLVV